MLVKTWGIFDIEKVGNDTAWLDYSITLMLTYIFPIYKNTNMKDGWKTMTDTIAETELQRFMC